MTATAYEKKSVQINDVLEQAIAALESLGASHRTAQILMAFHVIHGMDDLDLLKQIRHEVNRSIIVVDPCIAEDTCVIIGECTCIQEQPEPNELN